MDLISVGEMVVDFLPGQEAGSYLRNAGGAPANVAIAAARNGLQTGMYCKLGNDDFGRFLAGCLQENGVALLSPKLTDEAVTTMAFVTLNEDHDRSFTFARKPGADMFLHKSEIKDEHLRDSRLLQAGSCSLSGGRAAEATKYALRRAHELNKLVGFDLNYRNLMWKDDKAACTKEVLSVLSYVDFLKLSEEEADMAGGRANFFKMMKEYHIAVLVLTLGGAGAELFYEGASHMLPAFPAKRVVDTTGAGDAFWGGFLSRLLNRGIAARSQLNLDILKDAVIYGNVSGSLAVREKGAIASLPARAQIEECLEAGQ